MPAAIRAGFLYFAIVFAAGFVLGTLRVIVLMRFTGELAAVALELPVILIISWLACSRVISRFTVPATVSERLAMGALAFCILMLAEWGLSVLVFNRSGAEYLAHLQTSPGLLGLAGQIAFALFPLFQSRQIERLKK